MKTPVIIEKKEIERQMVPNPFGGKEGDAGLMNMAVKPPDVDTKCVIAGVAIVNPGYAAHRWHNHIEDKVESIGLQVNYPKDFEEVYYIVSGSGLVQWEMEEGKIEEREVSDGDIIFFPIDVAKHQLVNTNSQKLVMVWMATPVTLITQTSAK